MAETGGTGRMHRWSALVLILATLVGCAPPDPPLRASSEHVDLLMHDEPPDGLIEWLEHAVVSYGERLGVNDPHVTVVVHDTAEDVRQVCRSSGDAPVVGCADGTKIYQNITYYPHELVHAVASHLGRPPAVIQEGLAEAIGCGTDGGLEHRTEPDRELIDWVADEDQFFAGPIGSSRARYYVAASFVRFLIERHGMDALLALYGALPKDAGRGRASARFEHIFGEPLESLVETWFAEGPRPWGRICEAVPECQLEMASPTSEVALVPGLDSTRFVHDDADGDGVAGYVGVLELDDTSDLMMSLEPLLHGAWRSASARLVPCFGSEIRNGTVALWFEGQSSTAGATRVLPGRYAIYVTAGLTDTALERDLRTHARVTLSAEPSSEAECRIQTISIPDGAASVRLVPDIDARLEADEYWYSVEAREGTSLDAAIFGSESGVAHCADACLPDCEDVPRPAAGAPVLSLERPALLRLTDVGGTNEVLQGNLILHR